MLKTSLVTMALFAVVGLSSSNVLAAGEGCSSYPCYGSESVPNTVAEIVVTGGPQQAEIRGNDGWVFNALTYEVSGLYYSSFGVFQPVGGGEYVNTTTQTSPPSTTPLDPNIFMKNNAQTFVNSHGEVP